MRKIFFILLIATGYTFISCSADDGQESDNNPIGLSGNQFDMVITKQPDFLTYQTAIELNGVLTLNTYHWQNNQFNNGALIDANTDIQLDIQDNVDASDWSFRVNLFQHQEFITVDQPRVIYILTSDVDLEVDDRIDFTVGEGGNINKFYIRHYNGAQTLIKNIELNAVRL